MLLWTVVEALRLDATAQLAGQGAVTELKTAMGTRNTVTAAQALMEQVVTKSCKHGDQRSDDEEKKRARRQSKTAEQDGMPPSEDEALPLMPQPRSASARLALLEEEKAGRAERRSIVPVALIRSISPPCPISHADIPPESRMGRTPRADSGHQPSGKSARRHLDSLSAHDAAPG